VRDGSRLWNFGRLPKYNGGDPDQRQYDRAPDPPFTGAKAPLAPGDLLNVTSNNFGLE
jgi:hypothetical protein